MLEKLKDLFALFRVGEQVSNPAAWKAGGNIATVLPTLLLAIVKIAGDFGYGIQLSAEEASSIGLGISTIVMFIINNISSKHAGLLPAKADNADSTTDTPSVHGVPAEAVVQPVNAALIAEAEQALARDRGR